MGKALSEGDVVARFLFNEPVAPEVLNPHLVPQIALDEAPLGSPYRTQDLASLLGGLARIAAFKIDTLIVAPLFEGELPAWIAPGPPQPDTVPGLARTGLGTLTGRASRTTAKRPARWMRTQLDRHRLEGCRGAAMAGRSESESQLPTPVRYRARASLRWGSTQPGRGKWQVYPLG